MLDRRRCGWATLRARIRGVYSGVPCQRELFLDRDAWTQSEGNTVRLPAWQPLGVFSRHAPMASRTTWRKGDGSPHRYLLRALGNRKLRAEPTGYGWGGRSVLSGAAYCSVSLSTNVHGVSGISVRLISRQLPLCAGRTKMSESATALLVLRRCAIVGQKSPTERMR